MSELSKYEQEAFEMGRQDGLAAASWVIDGNTSPDHIALMVKWQEDGDPQAYDYLPVRPSLSGEWANDLTPHRLYDEVTGLRHEDRIPENEDADIEIMDAICDAYEAGVDETFEVECERILRAALED